jgi:hypothetical protein
VPLGSAGHRVSLTYPNVAHPGQSPAPSTYIKRHRRPLQSSNRRFGLVKSPPSQENLFLHQGHEEVLGLINQPVPRGFDLVDSIRMSGVTT